MLGGLFFVAAHAAEGRASAFIAVLLDRAEMVKVPVLTPRELADRLGLVSST